MAITILLIVVGCLALALLGAVLGTFTDKWADNFLVMEGDERNAEGGANSNTRPGN